MEGVFTIKTETFEGPLDLLLQLIEKRKIFVNDISLAQVADDYIEHVKELESFPIEKTAHFILIASTLLLIKSKSLLPSIPLTEEEQGSIEDLETRLKLYQQIQERAKFLGGVFGKRVIFFKTPSKHTIPMFSPEESITTGNLHEGIRRVLARIPKDESLPKTIVRKVISLEEMIDRLTERIQSSLKLSFRDMTGTTESPLDGEQKASVIISFLAMLELVKRGIVDAYQNNFSEDITIETKDVGVPNYH